MYIKTNVESTTLLTPSQQQLHNTQHIYWYKLLL